MKTTVLSKCATVVLLTLLVFIGGWMTTPPGVEAQANTSHVAAAGLQAEPPSQGIPLTFIENSGQFDTRVRFQASNGNTTLFLTDDALWVSLTDLPPQADPVSEAKTLGAVAGADETGRQVNLKLSFSGANPHPRLEPFEEQAVKVSFLTGADPSHWRTDVPAWAGVRYVDLYPGIDLEIAGQNGQLTPRLVVREPASLQNVSLRVEGADALAVKDNHLRLITSLGDFALPLLTVEGADPKIEPAISVVDEVQQVVAPFASMSPFATAVTPTGTPTLLYSTYFGGSGQDQASDIALDSAGNVYIIGRTYSTNLPTTPGVYDISQNGAYDVFVTKLSADGSRLLYSTYLGGSNEDIGTGIAVDSAGNAYITGHTYSTNFPTTPGASDTTLNGGRDGFAAKLNAAGNGLVYSTYLGGADWDYGQSIALDDSGSAYVGGFTHGSFPVMAGAAQTVFGGMGDGFATKLSPDGRTVLYSTYIGGNSWEGADGIAVDHAGHAYVVTGTASTDYPTTPGAWDRTCDNCSTNYSTDAAVAKLNADGSAFIYSTLIGGADAPASEWFDDIAVDSSGNAYLTGVSTSTDFSTTPHALQPGLGGGQDVVVVKLNASGSDLLYSTYLGGSGVDRGYGIAIDGNGNAFVTGYTASTDFPTANPLQAANAGGYDAFLAVVNTDASALLYSSYLGGSGDENRDRNSDSTDHCGEIALDRTGQIVYLAGFTDSTGFPTTANAYDRSFNGGASDAFVTGLSVTTDTDTFTRITSGDIVNEGGRSTGACWGDYDNDGYVDLFVANWEGQNNFLYHNNGDGTFEKITSGRIVNDGGWSRSCTWGDYDNDGYVDLAVSDDGGGIFLYHNEGGASFTRVLDTPIAQDYGNCYGISWADYDNDGWLDLFVARHTDANNLLYHNRGNGAFEKVTTGAIVNDGGASVSVSWGDYDGDGCVDLFVGNVNSQPNFLYHNNCNGSFDKITDGPFAADRGFSTTSNWVDYDNDGDLDLFVGNWYENNFLYRNDGSGTFTKITTGVIVTDGNIHSSSWADYDNDGDIDLVGGTPEGLRRFYQNNGDGTFTRITTGVVAEDNRTAGPAWADYDNDGDLDLFVAVNDPPHTNRLYRNGGNANHWLHLKLIGAAPKQARTATVSNKSAIGTRVTVAATINGRAVQQMQEVSGQTGVFSQNSPNVEFGLGDATVINAVSIRWPSGAVQVLTNMAVDQVLTIREPRRPLKRYYLPLMNNTPQSAQGSLYFVRGDVLYQMNLDGSDLRSVAQGLQGNEALVVDPIHRKIYAGRWEQPAQIQIFDMSAGELKAFSDGPGWGGQGMALDPAGLNLYRGLYYSGVYVMNLNSAGNWTQLVNSASLDPMYGQRGQLQVDPVNRYIYFRSSHNSCQSCRYIWRVNYDGSALTRIIPANGGDALVLDLTERKMYFTDLPGDYTIKRANLDGSAVETLLTIPGAYHFSSIALDANSRKMYLSLWNKDSEPQTFKRAIARINMDGSGFEILHTIAGNTGEEVVGEMALYLPTSPAPEPPLLVRYDFEGDFTTSGTVFDRSGNGHDAQVTGAVASATGISGGQGIAFNGGHLQAASNPAAGKTNVTFSLWFKTDGPAENYKLASGAWWDWGPGSGWIMATHIPEFWSDDGQGVVLPDQPNNDNSFPAGEWIHEVATYDGSRIKEYTNGQLINDWAATDAALGQGNPMVVGAWPPFTAYNFRGSMDEFAIYGRSLTAEEVQALYAEGR